VAEVTPQSGVVCFQAGNDRVDAVEGFGEPRSVLKIGAGVFVLACAEAVDVGPGCFAADEGELGRSHPHYVAILSVELLQPLDNCARACVESVGNAGRYSEPGARDVAEGTEIDVVYRGSKYVEDELGGLVHADSTVIENSESLTEDSSIAIEEASLIGLRR
jgi:hypothetical protein